MICGWCLVDYDSHDGHDHDSHDDHDDDDNHHDVPDLSAPVLLLQAGPQLPQLDGLALGRLGLLGLGEHPDGGERA